MGEQDATNDTNRQDVSKILPADSAPPETPPVENNSSTGADTNFIGLQNVGMSTEPNPPPSSSAPAPEISSARATPSPPTSSSILSPDDLPVRGLVARRARAEIKLEKILALAEKQGSIRNDNVEKLLRVSDATAARYLATLVKNGALLRAGAPGHARYELSASKKRQVLP